MQGTAWTSRRKNNGIIFNRASKVRRTFNHYVPPSPGKGVRGMGCSMRQTLSVNAFWHCHLSRGERQERPDAALICIMRGDVGIAPYTHHLIKSTYVGDGLWTSREL